MNRFFTAMLCGAVAAALAGCGRSAESTTSGGGLVASAAAEEIVEVGCAGCMYHMEGIEGCVTAAKIGDTPYLVTGEKLDAHGSGLCTGVKQAKVVGQVQDGKFFATQIELLKE